MDDTKYDTGVLLTTEVRELLQLLEQSDITELEIEHNGARVHIKRGHAAPIMHMAPHGAPMMVTAPQAMIPLAAPVPAPAGEPAVEVVGLTINSPMVGTFYIAPAPNEPPFVQEGEEVHPGTVVGIVEAMKMMNQIESEIGGRIARVLVQNGQPVEYGQALFVVEPLA